MQKVLMDVFGKQQFKFGLYKTVCPSDFNVSEFDFLF